MRIFTQAYNGKPIDLRGAQRHRCQSRRIQDQSYFDYALGQRFINSANIRIALKGKGDENLTDSMFQNEPWQISDLAGYRQIACPVAWLIFNETEDVHARPASVTDGARSAPGHPSGADDQNGRGI